MKPLSTNRLRELLKVTGELLCNPSGIHKNPPSISEIDLELSELHRLLASCLKYSIQKQKLQESARNSYQIRKKKLLLGIKANTPLNEK